MFSSRARYGSISPCSALVALLAFTACTGANIPQVRPPSPAGTGTASPPAIAPSDAAEIEELIREFVDATADQDWVRATTLTDGELEDWFEVAAQAGPVPVPRLEGVVQSIGIAGVEGRTVELVLSAAVVFAEDGSTALDFSGPARVIRRPSGWRLVTYTRSGRDALDSYFTNVRGTASRSGIDVEVLGANLAAASTFLVLRVSNRTDSQVEAGRSTAIIEASGKRHTVGAAAFPEAFELARGASSVVPLRFPDVVLPTETRSFRLTFDLLAARTHTSIEFDFPVRLID